MRHRTIQVALIKIDFRYHNRVLDRYDMHFVIYWIMEGNLIFFKRRNKSNNWSVMTSIVPLIQSVFHCFKFEWIHIVIVKNLPCPNPLIAHKAAMNFIQLRQYKTYCTRMPTIMQALLFTRQVKCVIYFLIRIVYQDLGIFNFLKGVSRMTGLNE